MVSSGTLALVDFTRQGKLHHLAFRIGGRLLLGKEKRDRLLEAHARKKLWKKFGLSDEAVRKTKRRISYVGWLGHDNLGDEALYKINTEIFEPFHLIPEIGTPYYSKITLFGGGTLLPSYASKVIPNEYNYGYGVGVRNPHFWGEPNASLTEKMKILNFRYLGVRGNTSKRLLNNWGIDCEVIGDPCLLLEPNHYEEGERGEGEKKIAINVGSDGLVWGDDEERVFREVGRLCKILKRSGYHPILIPFYRNNLHDIQRISEATNTRVFRNWMNIQEVLDLIASCRVLIGEKLHSVIFSAATHTPFISLEYRPKCRDFAETLGFEKYIVKTDGIKAEKVMRTFYDLSNNWTEMHRELVRNVETYRKRLRQFATKIKKDIQFNIAGEP